MPLKLEPDARIAHYRLVRFLGKGGFGEVWEADSDGLRVALKFLTIEDDLNAAEQRSLELLRNVRHPNLVEYHYTALVDGSLVIAMSLCDGSLMDQLKQRKAQGLAGLPLEDLRSATTEAAKAIDFLNEARHAGVDGRKVGIQHRDIKPHNLLTVGGSVRVADFGLARMLERTVSSHSGGMTPAYAAPEMVKGQLTPFTDQYSLAVTYYQLRLGRLPFVGNHARILYQHLHEEPDWTGLAEEERLALSVAMAKDPQNRWESCLRFARELQGATAAVGASSSKKISTKTAEFVREPAPSSKPSTKAPSAPRAEPETEPKSAPRASTTPLRRPLPPHLEGRRRAAPQPPPPVPPPPPAVAPRGKWRWHLLKWMLILGLPAAGGWWLSENWRGLIPGGEVASRSAEFRVVGLPSGAVLECSNPGVEIRVEEKTVRWTQSTKKGIKGKYLPSAKSGGGRPTGGAADQVREYVVWVPDPFATPKITLQATVNGSRLPDRIVSVRPGENPAVDYFKSDSDRTNR